MDKAATVFTHRLAGNGVVTRAISRRAQAAGAGHQASLINAEQIALDIAMTHLSIGTGAGQSNLTGESTTHVKVQLGAAVVGLFQVVVGLGERLHPVGIQIVHGGSGPAIAFVLEAILGKTFLHR